MEAKDFCGAVASLLGDNELGMRLFLEMFGGCVCSPSQAR